MTEQELYDTLFAKLCDSKDAHYKATSEWYASKEFHDESLNEKQREKLRSKIPPVYLVEAYAELAKDLTAQHLNLDWKSGTTVRIVMCSRLGDLGLTRKLADQHGYDIRVAPGAGYLTNCRLTKKRE